MYNPRAFDTFTGYFGGVYSRGMPFQLVPMTKCSRDLWLTSCASFAADEVNSKQKPCAQYYQSKPVAKSQRFMKTLEKLVQSAPLNWRVSCSFLNF